MLLVNLGTPDATDYWSMRRYLKEFLSDRRVIEENRIKWWLALNLVILTIRPGRKGRDYAKIWNKERNEFAAQDHHARAGGKARGDACRTDKRSASTGRCATAIRRFRSRLEALRRRGLRPHSGRAALSAICRGDHRDRLRRRPSSALGACAGSRALRVAPRLITTEPAYIDALAMSLQPALAKLTFKPEVILASFHGMPEEYLRQGRSLLPPLHETARLLRQRLKLDEDKLRLTFQSRFGFAEWLKPYTDATVKALAEKGVKNLAVITPGFSADCLETLEEIAMENAEIFSHAGGENFAAIPCLNDSDGGMAVIRDVVLRELKGWI